MMRTAGLRVFMFCTALAVLPTGGSGAGSFGGDGWWFMTPKAGHVQNWTQTLFAYGTADVYAGCDVRLLNQAGMPLQSVVTTAQPGYYPFSDVGIWSVTLPLPPSGWPPANDHVLFLYEAVAGLPVRAFEDPIIVP